MKKLSCTFLPFLLVLGFVFMTACSRIEIQKPAEEEQNITPPYTLIVKHTGCGDVKPETFKALLDMNSDSTQDITGAFSYSSDTWTAPDFNLPMGNLTLMVSAEVSRGAWCISGKNRDSRSFFVAPCKDFEQAWGVDFELSPDTIIIVYDSIMVSIAQGETKTISLPENSPYLVDGKLPATAVYGIKNTTTKNLKFRVVLRHGENLLYSKDLAFCGEGIVEEKHGVTISPSNTPLNLIIEGGDILQSPSDDTRPVFFNGKLQLRVYPL